MEFGRPWTYNPSKWMSLVLMDLQDIPKYSIAEDHIDVAGIEESFNFATCNLGLDCKFGK